MKKEIVLKGLQTVYGFHVLATENAGNDNRQNNHVTNVRPKASTFYVKKRL